LIASLVIASLYLPATLFAPLALAHHQLASQSVKPGTGGAPVWPQFGGSAFGAIGYDGLLERNGTTDPLPIASISKIVTALVVLDAKPLKLGEEGPTITFSAADHDLYAKYLALQGSVKPMPVGSTMTEHQVLQVALIASANNYADALAQWAFGSGGSYVAATKTWLSTHGLNQTILVEPTGIDPRNTSTTSDLVALGKLALADPVIAKIVDTPTLTLPVVGTIADTNQLLGKEGVIGIKTGTLATSSLLFASRFVIGGKQITVVGAVLGGSKTTIYPAVSAVLASIKSGFHSITLATKGESFGTYTTRWSQRANAVAESTESVVVWGDTPIATKVALAELRVGRRGEPTGTVKFVSGHAITVVKLELDHALSDPGLFWRLSNPVPVFTQR